MRNSLHIFLVLLIGILFQTTASATHNRAGEITVDTVGECTSLVIRATIVTYTKASSVAADRDSLQICWGDGQCEMVARSNGNGFGEILENDTKLNLYIITHKYPGRGSYLISMT
ncbi:MAG: gliding motility-associated C-terminal domain-containing protein, partial [Bacteroidota bacterium]